MAIHHHPRPTVLHAFTTWIWLDLLSVCANCSSLPSGFSLSTHAVTSTALSSSLCQTFSHGPAESCFLAFCQLVPVWHNLGRNAPADRPSFDLSLSSSCELRSSRWVSPGSPCCLCFVGTGSSRLPCFIVVLCLFLSWHESMILSADKPHVFVLPLVHNVKFIQLRSLGI